MNSEADLLGFGRWRFLRNVELSDREDVASCEKGGNAVVVGRLMPKSKFHHFVQCAHLALFTDVNRTLRIRGKDGGNFPTSPDAVFAENNLYCYESEEGITSEFEDAMTELENLTFPTLSEIAERRTLDPRKRIDVNTYLAASYLRNPAFRKMVIAKHELIAKDMAAFVDAEG